MKKNIHYLTMKEKKELAKQGLDVPLIVNSSSQKNGFIAKIRGTIFNGSLTNKRIKL